MNFFKKFNHYQIIFLITLIFVSTFYGFKYQEKQTSTDKFVEAKVVRVIDGDTIVCQVDDIQQPVRLIGIDTPESVHPDPSKNTEAGYAASYITKQLLTDKTIWLETDIQVNDKYGRLLAYVWLEKPDKISNEAISGKMYNYILLKNGYAALMTIPPNTKYVDQFRSAAKIK